MEPATLLSTALTQIDSLGLAASLDPAAFLQAGLDPIPAVRELGPWLAHVYAGDAAGQVRSTRIANPRGLGFAPGVLDWEEYLGTLEEVDYRGFMTVWPDPGGDQAGQFRHAMELFKRF
jgi:sugar phosphate isomerase/epimerase